MRHYRSPNYWTHVETDGWTSSLPDREVNHVIDLIPPDKAPE